MMVTDEFDFLIKGSGYLISDESFYRINRKSVIRLLKLIRFVNHNFSSIKIRDRLNYSSDSYLDSQRKRYRSGKDIDKWLPHLRIYNLVPDTVEKLISAMNEHKVPTLFDNITALSINSSVFTSFPNEFLLLFPNVTVLHVSFTSENCYMNKPFSNLDNLISMKLSMPNLAKMSNLFVNLPNLKNLNIDETNIRHLPDNFFKGLSNQLINRFRLPAQQELVIGIYAKLGFKYTDDNSFTTQKTWYDIEGNVTNLNFQGPIDRAPKHGFDDLSKLKELSLKSNLINELPERIFDDLSNLKDLYLGFNLINKLPDGIFDNLTNLEFLYLGQNFIDKLPNGIFDNLTKLRTLVLDHNLISNLPNGIFDNLGRLERLELGKNKLSKLPLGVFDNLGELTELGLWDNPICDLPERIFDKTTKMNYLWLRNISIINLSPTIFDNLNDLISVDLSDNSLKELSINSFNKHPKLGLLELNNNSLSKLPEGIFDQNIKLYKLDLPGNLLPELINREFSDIQDSRYEALYPFKAALRKSNKLI